MPQQSVQCRPPHFKQGEVAKYLGEAWRGMDAAEKQRWEGEAMLEKQRYQVALASWSAAEGGQLQVLISTANPVRHGAPQGHINSHPSDSHH